MSNKLDWNSRRKCTTKEQAVVILATVPVLEYITILEGHIGYANVLWGRVVEFAEIWGVPVSQSAMIGVAMQRYEEVAGYEYSADYDSGAYNGWLSSVC